MAEANNTEERPNKMILGQLERKRATGSFTRKIKAKLIAHTVTSSLKHAEATLDNLRTFTATCQSWFNHRVVTTQV